MRRDVVGIDSDGGKTRPHKHIHRDGRHVEHTRRVLKTHPVAVRTEEGDATRISRHSKGLQSFKGLLAIVEAWCQAVDVHVRVGYDLQGRPFAGGLVVGGFDMAIDCVKNR